MTDNMARLQELINESKKIREDVKTETEKLKSEYLENRTAQYKKLCETLKPYFDLCEGIGFPNVYLSVDNESKYTIRFGQPALTIEIKNGKCDYYLGKFDIRDPYKDSYRSVSRECNFPSYKKEHYLDDFMDIFDEKILEENFAAMVTDRLAELAKKTDEEYQNVKAKLEADNR